MKNRYVQGVMIIRILLVFLSILSSTLGTSDVNFGMTFPEEYIDTRVPVVPEVSSTARTLVPTDADEDSARVSADPKTLDMLSSHSSITNPVDDFGALITAPSNIGSKLAEVHVNSENDYDDAEIELSRYKRTLTFPDPSTILLIFGLGTPLQLDRESIIVGAFAKMIYNLPLNSTDFTEPGVYFARTKSRWSIYKALERAAEHYGFGAGKGCLLRAICDAAAAPFDHHHGLLEQMAQAFLTPSSTSEEYDEYGDREYHAAERLGWNVDENCHALYPECDRSVLDVFSNVATTRTIESTTTSTTPASVLTAGID